MISESERFWGKVNKTATCWEWTAYRLQGYGRFGVGGRGGRIVYAHRWSYEHLVGPIPEGQVIDHLCLNRACVRPDHLEVVTPGENSRRALQQLRAERTHCAAGHEFTDENTLWSKDGDGYVSRKCRECHRLRMEARSRVEGRPSRADLAAATASRTECVNGHPWVESNLYRSGGRAHCRACSAEAQRRYRARKVSV